MKFDTETILKLCKILLLVVVLYLLLRVLRFFLGGKGSNQVNLDERSTLDGSSPTITVNASLNLADKLHKAMSDFGTDEDAITAVLMKINGAADLIRVHNAFGVRPYMKLFGTSSKGWFDEFYSENLTLKEWLSEELTEKELAPWKHLYDQIG